MVAVEGLASQFRPMTLAISPSKTSLYSRRRTKTSCKSCEPKPRKSRRRVLWLANPRSLARQDLHWRVVLCCPCRSSERYHRTEAIDLHLHRVLVKAILHPVVLRTLLHLYSSPSRQVKTMRGGRHQALLRHCPTNPAFPYSHRVVSSRFQGFQRHSQLRPIHPHP